MKWAYKVGIGVDSHAFEKSSIEKPLILGGVKISDSMGLKGNSDADVVLHAVTDAISSITGKNIIGTISDRLCKNGITNSDAYLELALRDLEKGNCTIEHISIAIEAKTPKLEPFLERMKTSVARVLKLSPNQVGITVTSGEELSDYGRGLGIKVIAVVTVFCER